MHIAHNLESLFAYFQFRVDNQKFLDNAVITPSEETGFHSATARNVKRSKSRH